MCVLENRHTQVGALAINNDTWELASLMAFIFQQLNNKHMMMLIYSSGYFWQAKSLLLCCSSNSTNKDIFQLL